MNKEDAHETKTAPSIGLAIITADFAGTKIDPQVCVSGKIRCRAKKAKANHPQESAISSQPTVRSAVAEGFPSDGPVSGHRARRAFKPTLVDRGLFFFEG